MAKAASRHHRVQRPFALGMESLSPHDEKSRDTAPAGAMGLHTFLERQVFGGSLSHDRSVMMNAKHGQVESSRDVEVGSSWAAMQAGADYIEKAQKTGARSEREQGHGDNNSQFAACTAARSSVSREGLYAEAAE